MSKPRSRIDEAVETLRERAVALIGSIHAQACILENAAMEPRIFAEHGMKIGQLSKELSTILAAVEALEPLETRP